MNDSFKIESKDQEPKLYALVLREEFSNTVSAWAGIDYTLERAFHRAKNDLNQNRPLTRVGFPVQWTPELWDIKPLRKALASCKTIEQHKVEPKPAFSKNKVMQEIIKKKDLKLLEIYRERFTEQEIKYLKEKIKHE